MLLKFEKESNMAKNEGGLDSINIVIKSPLFYITLVFDQQVYCFSLSVYLTSLQFSLSMNYHLHCFSINMVFNQHCFRSTLLIICIKFSQHIKTSQLLFNLWLNFNLNCFSITCIIFSLYCFSISTDFRSTLVDLDFNLYCFSITCIIFNLYCQWGRNWWESEDRSSPKFENFIENNSNIWKKLVQILT